MSKVVGFMDVGRDWKFSESGIGNGGKVAGAAALLELGVWHRSVKLDGGGRRTELLDRQFGGGGAFLFFRLIVGNSWVKIPFEICTFSLPNSWSLVV